MTMLNYLLSFFMAFIIALAFTPLMRSLAHRWQWLDHPSTEIKTHKQPVAYLGGVAIWIAFVLTLVFIRFYTDFPTGTLHSLRGILLGSFFIVIVGLIDDYRPLGFKKKFLGQIIAAIILVYFGIQLKFIYPNYMAILISLIWIVGITNGLNIIDIMDGLAGGVAAISAFAFLFISLPTEEIYVNFAAIALAGACCGFLPFNFNRATIFMGDTGSLLLGFVLASVSLGTSYTKFNSIALFAPLLILAIPIYDTCLVVILRFRQGRSPFLGSKDHFALRLEALGLNRKQVVLLTYLVSIILCFLAWAVTRVNFIGAVVIYGLIIISAVLVFHRLSKIKME
ncbi:MAG: MraY family glycosyltransferase [Elusimicrobiota bacterium]